MAPLLGEIIIKRKDKKYKVNYLSLKEFLEKSRPAENGSRSGRIHYIGYKFL